MHAAGATKNDGYSIVRSTGMITAERKPLSEIKEMIAAYSTVLVVGCGSCVAECAAEGEFDSALNNE